MAGAWKRIEALSVNSVRRVGPSVRFVPVRWETMGLGRKGYNRRERNPAGRLKKLVYKGSYLNENLTPQERDQKQAEVSPMLESEYYRQVKIWNEEYFRMRDDYKKMAEEEMNRRKKGDTEQMTPEERQRKREERAARIERNYQNYVKLRTAQALDARMRRKPKWDRQEEERKAGVLRRLDKVRQLAAHSPTWLDTEEKLDKRVNEVVDDFLKKLEEMSPTGFVRAKGGATGSIGTAPRVPMTNAGIIPQSSGRTGKDVPAYQEPAIRILESLAKIQKKKKERMQAEQEAPVKVDEQAAINVESTAEGGPQGEDPKPEGEQPKRNDPTPE